MRTIRFQVTDEKYYRALAVLETAYDCCPGFDIGKLAALALDLHCHTQEQAVLNERNRALAAGTIIPGPWKAREVNKPKAAR